MRVDPKSIYRWLNWGIEHGLEGALERQPGRATLNSFQVETLGQWIRVGRRNQRAYALIALAMELFGIDLNRKVAFILLHLHRPAKASRGPKRLWHPVKPRARRTDPTHDPASRL